jgi:hypothetical protein
MKWTVANIKWIMLVSGALTCTMLYAAIAPQAALLSTFDQVLEGPVAEIVVRNWGVLIGLIGAMLIYGAFTPMVRPLVLSVATASKLVFIVLVLAYGFGNKVAVPVTVDLVVSLLFVTYLVALRRPKAMA